MRETARDIAGPPGYRSVLFDHGGYGRSDDLDDKCV